MRISTKITYSSLALIILLAGCAVGPNFKKPASPSVKAYTEKELPKQTTAADTMAGAAQTFIDNKNIPAEWWKLFGSEPLNTIVATALKANPDLQIAKATLTQAQEQFYAGEGSLFPAIDASFAPSRQKFSSAAFGQPNAPSSVFTLYNASVNVSYGVDIFGGTRRAIESLKAQVDIQQYEMQAAYLTLTTNVVTTAIQEASLSEQIKATQDIIDSQTKQLNVLKTQFELGGIAKTPVLEQQAALTQTKATMPTLEKQLAQMKKMRKLLN
jgi:NodT family efflux transporter outer membrane factor (OMF) lipoprotein